MAVLKTTQLSAHAQNHASPERCRKSFTMIFLGDHDIPLTGSNFGNLIAFSGVVTTIEISPPPSWLATTEPTSPPRCFTVFSAVFLGTVYCASVFRNAACSDSHLMLRHLIPCET